MQDIANSSDQVIEFFDGMGKFFWESGELLLDIFLEFCRRSIELVLVVLTLILGILCFFRDSCVHAIRTFCNAICGLINIISGIDCEDLEDFASAGVVFILWFFALKFLLHAIDQTRERYSPKKFLVKLLQATLQDNKLESPKSCTDFDDNTWLYNQNPIKKKTSGKRKRRNSARR